MDSKVMFERFKKRPARNEVEQLIDAGILDGSERMVERGLAAQALRGSGSIPSIVGNFGGSTPLPDLTATEMGRATLDELDNFVRQQRIQGLHDHGSSPE